MAEASKPTVAPSASVAQDSPDMEIGDTSSVKPPKRRWSTVEKLTAKAGVKTEEKPSVVYTPESLRASVIAEDKRRMTAAKKYGQECRNWVVRMAVRSALKGMGATTSKDEIDALVKRVCKPLHSVGWYYDKKGLRRIRRLTLDRAIAYSLGASCDGAEEWLVKLWLQNPNLSGIVVSLAAVADTVDDLVSESIAAQKDAPIEAQAVVTNVQENTSGND